MRQKSIAVTVREKERLDKAKHLYECATSQKLDWGEFLRQITILGLIQLGIYTRGVRIEYRLGGVRLRCTYCKKIFDVALPEFSRVILVECTNCGREVGAYLPIK